MIETSAIEAANSCTVRKAGNRDYPSRPFGKPPKIYPAFFSGVRASNHAQFESTL